MDTQLDAQACMRDVCRYKGTGTLGWEASKQNTDSGTGADPLSAPALTEFCALWGDALWHVSLSSSNNKNFKTEFTLEWIPSLHSPCAGSRRESVLPSLSSPAPGEEPGAACAGSEPSHSDV